MFNIDAKARKRIAQHVDRVLIVDPNMATTRLLTDLLKDLGVSHRLHETTTARALATAADWAPKLILVELNAPDLDGLEFTRRLRRSNLAARQAPVIIVTADTRETSIKAARDAGAHEFLCKPFTAGHLFRRVENVTLKPRPWVEAKLYVGPDRRRFNSGQFEGTRKRRADNSLSAAAILAFANVDTSIRAQFDLIETDPQTALLNMVARTAEFRTIVGGREETPLSLAIGALQQYLGGAMEQGGPSARIIEQHLMAIHACREKAASSARSASQTPVIEQALVA